MRVFLEKAASEYGVELSEKQLQQFQRYYELLIEWNEKINLTAITEPQEVAVKHFIDSVSAWDEKRFEGAKSIIDVGTGAGFPGIPLAINSKAQITLLDSLNKRINFLNEVKNKLNRFMFFSFLFHKFYEYVQKRIRIERMKPSSQFSL